jgi:NAD(P)-dependent dehydrogenase (short-subunit alcohol dehydrogenase family)
MATLAHKVVLITGASSGIGAATASRLASAGFRVYATARRVDALGELRAKGCETLRLDVTDETSMREAVETIETREGSVGALINNAGYCQPGALETLPIEAVRHQFDTNVFGVLRMAQLVLPGMRKAGAGRIVNLSSMGGKLVFPGLGAYHASKYAVEALSDVLRFEVKGFGIDVVIIEPGIIRSGFVDAAITKMPHGGADGPYVEFDATIPRAMKEIYEHGVLAKLGGTPDDVAKVIEDALTESSPKTRYTVTASAHLLMAQHAVMSDNLWDHFLAAQFPRPGEAR